MNEQDMTQGTYGAVSLAKAASTTAAMFAKPWAVQVCLDKFPPLREQACIQNCLTGLHQQGDTLVQQTHMRSRQPLQRWAT